MFEPMEFVTLGLFSDFNFVLKIFVMLTIISFVKNHLGTGPLAIGLMFGFGWFIFFDAWVLFGGIYLFYMLLAMGFSGVLIDFFFVSGGPGDQGAQQEAAMKHTQQQMGRR